ncbi:Uncharacterised protein [Vibrio cholerae]|uniref:Uncharacterized protein n=1 Tax=Vibrio cholerae TaxID=666 RepID=A0A655Q784_VIBCL|nr:Uncharacterised protein [Vibrio cholerae]CSB00525.1 Uncharacterised protein [Vibrio cholerae]CSB22213.1 Uncharacterised protein [Vibrio cholerae]CSB76712.1 Uncharacterised protein [Vibrio cholerae]CSB77402.1 Uncharacterised protein [Vibrio cholerae]
MLKGFTDQAIIFIALNRGDLTGKRSTATKVAEHRLHDIDLVEIDITQRRSIVFHSFVLLAKVFQRVYRVIESLQ